MSIRNTNNKYVELDKIGIGAYGTVYSAYDKNNRESVVALKKVRITLTENGVPNSTLREIALLKQLETFDHPNIVKLLDVCNGPFLKRERQLVLYLVFEHMKEDLASYLHRQPNMEIKSAERQRLSTELLTGIDFLHSHRIIHRDLKPQNLLVSSLGRLKLADFGLAKTYDFEMRLTSVVVTLWYRAPEVLLNQPYTSALDIWSAACIMAELFQRRPLFPGSSERNQLERIFDLTGTPSSDLWPDNVSIPRESFQPFKQPTPLVDLCDNLCEEANDLLSQMLAFDPKIRPSAFECLQHSYFQQEPI